MRKGIPFTLLIVFGIRTSSPERKRPPFFVIFVIAGAASSGTPNVKTAAGSAGSPGFPRIVVASLKESSILPELSLLLLKSGLMVMEIPLSVETMFRRFSSDFGVRNGSTPVFGLICSSVKSRRGIIILPQ